MSGPAGGVRYLRRIDTYAATHPRRVLAPLATVVVLATVGGVAGAAVRPFSVKAFTPAQAVAAFRRQHFAAVAPGASAGGPRTLSVSPVSTVAQQTSPGAAAPVPVAPPSGTWPRPGGQAASTAPTDGPLPALGVYSYATSGSENVSIPGGNRAYPATTTITVEPDGCGVTARWVPLQQHWEEQHLCAIGGGVVADRYRVQETYYGQTTNQTIGCPSGAWVIPPAPTAGSRWSFSCSSPQSRWDVAAAVVGFGSLTVGGVAVPAVHVTFDFHLSGSQQGRKTEDDWYATRTLLLLRRAAAIDAAETAGFLGSLSYHSAYTLTLDSLTPAR